MKWQNTGPVYGLWIFLLVAGIVTLAAGALLVIFRGNPAFNVDVFGAVDGATDRTDPAIRGLEDGRLRVGFLPDLDELRYADGFSPDGDWTPPPPDPKREALQQARVWASEEAWSRALPAYERLVRSWPGDAELALERARVLSWAGDPAAAAAALSAVPSNRPDAAALKLEAARYYWWAGDVARADSVLGTIAPGAASAEAIALRDEIRRSASPDVRTARRWLAERSGSMERLHLARALVREQRYDESLEHYMDAISSGSVPDSVYLELASAAAAADEPELVTETLVRYLRIHPLDRNARITLARAYSWSRDHRRAIAVYRELLAGEDDPDLRFEMAQLRAWNDDQLAAEADLLRILEQRPTHAPSFQLLGDLARWRGDFEAAAVYYERAIALDPSLTGVRQALADTERERLAAAQAGAPVQIEQCTIGVDSFSDSQGFHWLATEATRVWQPDWGTLSLAVNQDLSGGAVGIDQREGRGGYGATAELKMPLSDRVTLQMLAGTRSFEGIGAFGTYGLGLEFADVLGATTTLAYTRQPAARRVATLAALEAETISNLVQLTVSRPIGSWYSWSQAELEQLHSDLGTTQRYSGSVSLSRPIGSRLTAAAGVSGIATRGDRPQLPQWGTLYWTPEYYVATDVSLTYRAPLGDHWSLGATVAPGYAFIREHADGERRFDGDQTAMLGMGLDLGWSDGPLSVTGRGYWSGALGPGYRSRTIQIHGSYVLDER